MRFMRGTWKNTQICGLFAAKKKNNKKQLYYNSM